MPFVEFENPACTTDMIVERIGENSRPEILLIKRAKDPYSGMWALPGGHIELKEETVEEAGIRELKEETGLVVKLDDLKLIGVYSAPDRDPRGHYVSHAYSTNEYSGKLKANDDASDTDWFRLDNLPKLAFDHLDIIRDYMKAKKC